MSSSSCNGHFVKGTKAGLFAELMMKGQIPLLEGFEVRAAIVHEVPLHVKLRVVGHLRGVALLEPSFACLGYGFRGVRLSQWHGTHIVDIGRSVEEMQKIPLLEIIGIQTKCLCKRSKRHHEERHGVDKADVPTLAGELQQFATRTHESKLLFALDQAFHHKVRVVALEIVGESRDVTGFLRGQLLQPLQKLLDTLFALNTQGVSSSAIISTTRLGRCTPVFCMASISQKISLILLTVCGSIRTILVACITVEPDPFINLNDACSVLELFMVSGDLHEALMMVQVGRFVAQQAFTVPASMFVLSIH